MSKQQRLGIGEATRIILSMSKAAPLTPPFWPVSAAVHLGEAGREGLTAHARAKAIYNEEVERTEAQVARDGAPAGAGSDDLYDAMRHAEASRRIAEAVGPAYAHLFGTAHEIRNILKRENRQEGDLWPRVLMDLYNNAEGRRAAREGRPVNPEDLRTLDPRARLPSHYRR